MKGFDFHSVDQTGTEWTPSASRKNLRAILRKYGNTRLANVEEALTTTDSRMPEARQSFPVNMVHQCRGVQIEEAWPIPDPSQKTPF